MGFDHNYVGRNYTGRNYMGHNYVDHKYVGRNYLGHDYFGHNYIGHDNTGHNYIGPYDAVFNRTMGFSFMESDLTDDEQTDGMLAADAVKRLQEFEAHGFGSGDNSSSSSKPFFLAVAYPLYRRNRHAVGDAEIEPI